MRHTLRACHVLPGLLLATIGCLADPLDSSSVAMESSLNRPSLSVVDPGPCSILYLTGGILQPINTDNSSTFQLGRTIPVKIRVSDCVTGEAVNTLAPQISLVNAGTGGTAVNEIISSSAADEGTTMRSAGDGQYIFNLSTKRSQFNAGEDLTAGVYELTISGGGQFADVVVQFALR